MPLGFRCGITRRYGISAEAMIGMLRMARVMRVNRGIFREARLQQHVVARSDRQRRHRQLLSDGAHGAGYGNLP